MPMPILRLLDIQFEMLPTYVLSPVYVLIRHDADVGASRLPDFAVTRFDAAMPPPIFDMPSNDATPIFAAALLPTMLP